MHRKAGKAKLQSAMEYLMTYGWAILIIAVVLGALFQLGIFSSTNFAPRAPPGSCRVARLAGTVNLEGVCSGQLPQYVAVGRQTWPSNILVADAPQIRNLQEFSVSFWVFYFLIPNAAGWPTVVGKGGESEGWRTYQDKTSPNLGFTYNSVTGPTNWPTGAYNLVANKWYHVVFTFSLSSGTATSYLNGVQQETPVAISQDSSTNLPFVMMDTLNGRLSNVQYYNTSLSASDIQTIYVAGIGGAPPFLRNLVGWWPLNGDANDYSGNNNNGVSAGVSYISSWINGYTPP